MADRTFGDLTLEILHDDFDTVKYTTRAQQAINDCLRELSRRVDLPALGATSTITTVAGTSSYTPPADLVRIKSLTDTATGYGLLELSSVEQFDEFLASSGTPSSYLLYGGVLLLYPTPNSVRTLRLRYRKDAGVLSASGDILTGAVPDDYAHMVVEYGRARLFRFEDDPAMADYWQGRYEESVAALRADIQRQTPRRRQVGDNRHRSRFGFLRP